MSIKKITIVPNTFASRLCEVCESESPTVISKRVGMTQPAIRNYLRTGRLPEADKLIQISKKTNTSIHWLLLGTGPRELAVLESIKDGQVDVKRLLRRALIDHHLLQTQMLSEDEARAQEEQESKSTQGESKGANHKINGS